MEVSKCLRDYSKTIAGKQQMIINAFAKALEVIPRQLCENAGFDAIEILNKLRLAHSKGEKWYGVDFETENIGDNFAKFVWEPALVKINALNSATEATNLILSVDETITNKGSESANAGMMPPQGAGRGRGMPM